MFINKIVKIDSNFSNRGEIYIYRNSRMAFRIRSSFFLFSLFLHFPRISVGPERWKNNGHTTRTPFRFDRARRVSLRPCLLSFFLGLSCSPSLALPPLSLSPSLRQFYSGFLSRPPPSLIEFLCTRVSPRLASPPVSRANGTMRLGDALWLGLGRRYRPPTDLSTSRTRRFISAIPLFLRLFHLSNRIYI